MSLIKQASQYSLFVKSLVSLHPKLINGALEWHIQHSDDEIKNKINKVFDDFSGDRKLLNESEIMRLLRIFRRVHSAAIAILELNNQIPIESSSARISYLADCLIQAAYQWCYEQQNNRFGIPICINGDKQNLIIVAMGKLGGEELNFSSDIDLIFFYPYSGTTQQGTKSIDNARFFNRLSIQLIKLLNEVTADGFVYRVDMRLRPYGDSGALVISYAQAEAYYQEQGREWERFAMIRARILTGSQNEQKQLRDIILPFSFRRYIDYGVIESIRNMKSMIQREIRRKGLQCNIKLGAGGIREVEFIVQSLQLIQGGRDTQLQERNVFKVLPLLVKAKLLPQAVADSLIDSYQFLRRVEHYIQEFDEKQTQNLPNNLPQQTTLAKILGFDNWQAFLTGLEKHQQQVNSHFNELLGTQRQQALTQDDFYQSLADGFISAEQLQVKLQQLSLPITNELSEEFLTILNQFLDDAKTKNLSPKGAKRLKIFFPSLLAVCLKQDAPVVVLQRLLKVLQSILKRTAYLELLSENPPVLEHLVDLAGKSPWIVKRLSSYPILFDELLYPNSLYAPLEESDLQAELRQNLLRVDEQDEEAMLDTLRTFKQTNELRVAAALLAQRLSISQVSRYLTQLAEVILMASVKYCWDQLTIKYGIPESVNKINFNDSPYSFAIIGYGKLGGNELGFGSDLDLVFLFDQPIKEQTNGNKPLNNSRFYTRLAQKIIHTLSTRTNLGALYEVDMRLRPSGSSGLLVSHIDAFFDYQMNSAWTWEHQALVRARFVAGDEKLQIKFQKIRSEVINQSREQAKLQLDIVTMRNKMREQLGVSKNQTLDLKQAEGGLIDIEFLAQYLCLSYQSEKPFPHNTVKILKLASDDGIMKKDAALTLINSYRLFRNQLNENILIGDTSLTEQPELNKQLKAQLKKVKLIWNETFNLK